MISDTIDRPLCGIMVIDLVASPLAGITRYLAELGAEVVRIEIDGRADAKHDLTGDRAQLSYVAANLGKRIETCASSVSALADHFARADLIVEDLSLDPNFSGLIDIASMRARNPALSVMTVSGFGSNTSYSGWQWTDAVLHALSAELARSGIRGREPLIPPGEIAAQCAIAQAAYCAVLALYNALATGRGDHMDFSALEGTAAALDPGYGVGGSATFGRPAKLLSPARPQKGFQYPILPCADGAVRICLLSSRQWMGMFKMLGEPAQFADPKYLKVLERYKCPDLLPAIASFFADKPRQLIEQQGQALGIPIAAMLTLADCLSADHIRERKVFTDVLLADGTTAPFPNGILEIDGVRMGPLCNADHTITPVRLHNPLIRPFDGLKVLDLGVIVVGAETGRLLADMGADVVKVESLAFPDGTRQTYLPTGLSVSFGAGHRNKRSLGLNLKSEKGKDLFRQLVAEADIVLSNFKPGTMESLGFGYQALAEINPRIVAVESSAFGNTGPWADRMGYGPLVRAATGLSDKWCYPADPDGFSDSITVYPDHVAARVGAMGAIALLIRRMRTLRGGRITISQAEVMLAHFAPEIAATALNRPDDGQTPDAPWPDAPWPDAPWPDAPWGVWQAAGDDEWCVVTVRNDRDWQSLLDVMGDDELRSLQFADRARRLADRGMIEQRVAAWMLGQNADDAMRSLQTAGVPAGRMLRVSEQPDFPYFAERGYFRTEAHPYLTDDLIAERYPVVSDILPEPDTRPAPLMGQHTFEVMRDWLGLSYDEIVQLAEQGTLETVSPVITALIEAGQHQEESA